MINYGVGSGGVVVYIWGSMEKLNPPAPQRMRPHQLIGLLLSIGGFAVMLLALSPLHAEEVVTSCGNTEIKAIRVQTPEKSARPLNAIDPTITSVASTDGTFLTVTILSPEFDTFSWIDTTQVTCKANGLVVSETFTVRPRVSCLSCSEAMVDRYRQPVQIDLVMHGKELSIEGRLSGHSAEPPVKEEGKPFTFHRTLHADATLTP